MNKTGIKIKLPSGEKNKMKQKNDKGEDGNESVGKTQRAWEEGQGRGNVRGACRK